jgi:c-di-GMP-binding flagellar brake protein YcgR
VSSGEDPARQRQFYRAPVAFPVSARIGEEDADVSSDAHDLSGAGIRISMERELDRGTPLEMRFHLPQGTSEIVAHGYVVLSFFEGASNRYHHGIAFSRIASGDREAIVNHIHEIQRRTPGQ